MPTIQIGFNSEFYGIGTYDVFVSNCDPISWQLVFDDIPFSDFPVDVNLDDFSITGTPCYRYYVSGDTGCYISTTATTENACPPTPTPTPSVTSSVTPTPSVTQSVTPSISITPTISVTPTQTVTPTMSVTPTPTPSIVCKEYSLVCPGTPNITVAFFNYTRCDGTVITNFSVSPGTSSTVCARVGTVSVASGPGTITELNECSA